jgi:GDP-L-fucose synthase
MQHYSQPDIINVGWGEDISIAELANVVKAIVDFKGEITFDSSQPDGTPRKLLEVSRLKSLGWQARIPLREGIKNTYDWYLANRQELRIDQAPGIES